MAITVGIADAPYILVGPPEARQSHSAALVTGAALAPTREEFPDLTDAFSNEFAALAAAAGPGGKALTENFSPTFVSSGDPCLDFFFHVVPGTPAASVESLLGAAWAADPDTALRLVANLRGVRGSGKSDREGFYASALWLHARHPRTLALNAAHLAPHRARRGVHQDPRQEGTPNHQVQPRPGPPRLLRQPYALQPRGTGRHARRLNGGARRGQPGARPGTRGRGRGGAPDQESGGRCEGGRDVQ